MIDAFTGDETGLGIPAHGDALLKAGPEFLTRAFHAFGALSPDNRVVAIRDWQPCPGGSTGAKFFMRLAYWREERGLPDDLFVKFARDFTDTRRDVRSWEMAGEARFAPLTRRARFPISVPVALFADYEAASGSGLLITERIAYGEAGIEPHRRKCLDHQTLPDPLPYYRTVAAASRASAAADKAGALGADVDARFPFDPATGSADPIGYGEAELAAELEHVFAYIRDCPQLVPPEVRDPGFLAQLAENAYLILEHEAEIQAFLTGDPRMIALCHWNAHIDNCWFIRNADGALQCGLIDWGRVGRITFGSALWGGFSAAHEAIWEHHLDEILALFTAEYAAHGGPLIAPQELTFHLRLHLAAMGVARVLAFPEVIRFRAPECIHASGPHDPMFEPVAMDPARNSMHIFGVFLRFWRRYDVGGAVRELLGREM
jgi:hypothetical protein